MMIQNDKAIIDQFDNVSVKFTPKTINMLCILQEVTYSALE